MVKSLAPVLVVLVGGGIVPLYRSFIITGWSPGQDIDCIDCTHREAPQTKGSSQKHTFTAACSRLQTELLHLCKDVAVPKRGKKWKEKEAFERRPVPMQLRLYNPANMTTYSTPRTR